MRILGVDPGETRIGIAVSDPSGTIANPLTVIAHVSRMVDAATIANLAAEYEVGLIVIGLSLDWDNQPTPQSRRATRLASAVEQQSQIDVRLWDETGSTKAAREAHIAMGGSRKDRRRRGRGHLDDLAATYILQTYLDSISTSG
jgi:putative holliday junction resolvase